MYLFCVNLHFLKYMEQYVYIQIQKLFSNRINLLFFRNCSNILIFFPIIRVFFSLLVFVIKVADISKY